MNLLRYALPLAVLFGLGTAFVYGQNMDGKTRFQQELEESDIVALRNFINAKRKIPLPDKSKNLHISGEVHVEWNYYTETLNGESVRVFTFREQETLNDEIFDPGETIAIGHNDFDVEFDLFVDWDTERTWARTHVRYDNSAGVDDNGQDRKIDPQGYHGSGSCNNLCLKEAYIGYELYKCGDDRLIIELGRRGSIYKEFYSELEFASRLDGVIFKYTRKLGGFADWYIKWAGFVVDERATQFAWVAETGFDNICDSGLDIKYSFIDWVKHGPNRYFQKFPLGFRFRVSQIAMIYHVNPDYVCGQPLQVFGAFLVNHTPSEVTFIDVNTDPAIYTGKEINIGKQNLGGFVGFQYRDIEKEGDWLVKAVVAFCEAQVIPDNDVRNLGTGNFLHDSFTSDGRGNVNWKGYGVKFGYAITDNLIVETQYDHTWALDPSIAGSHSFTRYLLETTYFF